MGFVPNAKRLTDDVIDQRWIYTIIKKGTTQGGACKNTTVSIT
jgi:hypothetical protein